MWWALIWAFLIGSAANADRSGIFAAILAFVAIWYFTWKSDEVARKSNATIAGLNSRIQTLEEASANSSKRYQEEEPDPTSPGYQTELEYRNAKRNGLI